MKEPAFECYSSDPHYELYKSRKGKYWLHVFFIKDGSEWHWEIVKDGKKFVIRSKDPYKTQESAKKDLLKHLDRAPEIFR